MPLTLTAGAATVVALALAVVLFAADRRDQGKGSVQALGHASARAGFDSVVAPASGVLAGPMRWISDGASSIGDYFFAVSENRRLKKRVAELQQLESTDIALRNLTRRYESLLKLRTEPPIPMVTGRVVTDTRGPFSNARLIDVGSDAGVKVGNPAMTEQGVVGRVVGVAGNASRLLLLTDPESRTPVLIDRTNARAVLNGDGGSNPKLDYLRGKDVVKDGDMVLTSGDGGLYPRGLPVGVAQRDLRGVWRIRLYSDKSPIDYVRVLVYDDFAQMVDQAKLAAAAMPPLTPGEAAKVQAAAVAATKPATPLNTSGAPPAAGGVSAQPPPKAAAPNAAPTPPAPVAAKAQPVSAPAPKPAAPKPATATAKPAAAKRPATKLPPGQYKRVHTPTVPPAEQFPQYDPSRPDGRGR